MGLMERFESSLQSLRGPNVDIHIESQEIKVLFFILPSSLYVTLTFYIFKCEKI
jgi:hypothetical protein